MNPLFLPTLMVLFRLQWNLLSSITTQPLYSSVSLHKHRCLSCSLNKYQSMNPLFLPVISRTQDQTFFIVGNFFRYFRMLLKVYLYCTTHLLLQDWQPKQASLNLTTFLFTMKNLTPEASIFHEYNITVCWHKCVHDKNGHSFSAWSVVMS